MVRRQADSEGILTLEEFEAMPEEDAYRLELVRGRGERDELKGGDVLPGFRLALEELFAG